MLNKSLFICYSTPNYSELANLCLESLNNLNVKNIDHKIDYFIDKDEHIGLMSMKWYICVKNKIIHLIHVLKKNYIKPNNIEYFIFTDCDIFYIDKNVSEWFNLEKYIKEKKNKDIFFPNETHFGFEKDLNTGFYIIKNNDNIENIIEFFSNVVKKYDNVSGKFLLGDQTIINKMKEDINFDIIPKEYLLLKYNMDGNKSLFYHPNSITFKDKIDGFNALKIVLNNENWFQIWQEDQKQAKNKLDKCNLRSNLKIDF